MNKLTTTNLVQSGMYLFLRVDGNEYFVARFKHNRKEARSYASFLRKNFTVEEVIAYTTANPDASMTKPMIAKGYVSKNMRNAYAQLITLNPDAPHWGGPITNGQFAEHLRNEYPGLN